MMFVPVDGELWQAAPKTDSGSLDTLATHTHSGSLGTLVMIVALTALALVAAAVGLWALRHRRSTGTEEVPAETVNGSGRGEAPESATAGFQPVLFDPTFGGWPITGDFPLRPAGARRSGQEVVA